MMRDYRFPTISGMRGLKIADGFGVSATASVALHVRGLKG